MQYLIANWKANKNIDEIHLWFDTFLSLLEQDEAVTNALESKKLHILICPTFPFLLSTKELIKNTGLSIGAQDVSGKDTGKYTGEVPAALISGIAEYAIIGHSERRSLFQESEEIIKEKIQQSIQHTISPILCIRDDKDAVHDLASLIAYEPVSAIGSGENEEPHLVLEMKKKISLQESQFFIYGGSVTRENILAYSETGEINGYLVGSASLDPQHFFDLAKAII